MQFHGEQGMRIPLRKEKNDRQRAQEHASYYIHEYANERKKAVKLKGQQSKKYQLWLRSGACVNHIRKISRSQF